jgi:hypothetical protein
MEIEALQLYWGGALSTDPVPLGVPSQTGRGNLPARAGCETGKVASEITLGVGHAGRPMSGPGEQTHSRIGFVRTRILQTTTFTGSRQAEVLRRYKDEDLPAFCEIVLEDVNQVGLFGERPLHLAAARGNIDEIAAVAGCYNFMDAQRNLRRIRHH